jgi:hypothetical protein
VQLKFYAREDQLVPVPGLGRAPKGSPAQYVGRTYDPSRRGYPATKEPFAADSESPLGQRLIERVRRDHDLWPADKETAAACDVEFAEIEFNEAGLWTRKETRSRRIVSAAAEGSAA